MCIAFKAIRMRTIFIIFTLVIVGVTFTSAMGQGLPPFPSLGKPPRAGVAPVENQEYHHLEKRQYGSSRLDLRSSA
ncbi:uncharacterized protein LOC108913353 isoform X3 [Anoplophora glabripennis]|uniref:uncharacterized protein LOC108913353 isoform X3 n=1 Tax=Anoplophora glabripennis TaxID=217634 RepID=UPI000873EDA5|nr:uncharacterized protein LOC108913353 isoform X3 [Anoplophora glabripennis]